VPARRGRGDSVATDVSSRSVPRAELRSRAIVARLGVALVTAAYVGYLALLVTCDLLQVAPLGFIPAFEPGRVIVGQLQPDSIVARAGLRAGDQLTRANGRVLEASGDWQRVRVDFDPSSVIYAGLGVAVLVAHRRAVDTLTDQRRIRVLIAGAVFRKFSRPDARAQSESA